MALTISIDHEAAVTVVKLQGYVEKEGAIRIRKQVEELISQGRRSIAIDFSLAPIVNSVGLAEFIDLVSMSMGTEDLHFAFFGLSDACRFSFNTVGMFHYVLELPDRSSAINSLK